MPSQIIFTGKQQVALQDFPSFPIASGQVRVQSLYSLMSTGTENIIFNRLFEPETHWDNWIRYPFFPGYATVGKISEVGADVSDLKPGDVVAIRAPHASEHLWSADGCYLVPEGLDRKQASWFALAKIAYMGAQAAGHTLGDCVLVIGAGPIGQMATRWAYAAGAETIIVVDTQVQRLELARRGGATFTIALPIGEAEEAIRKATQGRLPRVVIDGTGNAEVFATALALARPHGRVVVLGDTGTPSHQHLTPALIMKGLTVIGAHDTHSHGDPVWNERAVVRLFGSLALSGRFPLEGLISHEFSPSQYAEAYALVNTRRGETMGVLFDWTRE